jgi:hypothetical protein
MTGTFAPPAPEAIRKPWSRTLQGMTALGALLVALGGIVVGGFGIEDVESFLDGLVQICLLYSLVALWLGSFVETLIVPQHLWRRAGQSWAVFVLLILLLPVLGALLYLAVARPALRRTALSL